MHKEENETKQDSHCKIQKEGRKIKIILNKFSSWIMKRHFIALSSVCGILHMVSLKRWYNRLPSLIMPGKGDVKGTKTDFIEMHSRTLYLHSHLRKNKINVFQWLLLECFADMQEMNWFGCVAIMLTCNRNKTVMKSRGNKEI
jgi:hypothetical protein